MLFEYPTPAGMLFEYPYISLNKVMHELNKVMHDQQFVTFGTHSTLFQHESVLFPFQTCKITLRRPWHDPWRCAQRPNRLQRPKQTQTRLPSGIRAPLLGQPRRSALTSRARRITC
jgi:hypothetical protein